PDPRSWSSVGASCPQTGTEIPAWPPWPSSFLREPAHSTCSFCHTQKAGSLSGWRKRWCLPPSLRPASSTGPVCCVRLVPESREIVLVSPRVGAYSAVNGPVRPQIVLKGPFSANGKCCCRRPIWRAPEGIPGVASPQFVRGTSIGSAFPAHIVGSTDPDSATYGGWPADAGQDVSGPHLLGTAPLPFHWPAPG